MGVIGAMEPVWRLYAPDWLTVFTSTRDGEAGKQECLGFFSERFEGRVHDEDWQIVIPESGWLTFLQVRLPSLKGEFTDATAAHRRAGEYEGLPHRVVRRGGPDERELQAYGRRRLQDAGGAGDAATG